MALGSGTKTYTDTEESYSIKTMEERDFRPLPLSFPPQLALHVVLGSCSLPVTGHHIQVSGVHCGYICTPALNTPERLSLNLTPADKGQPTSILFSSDQSGYSVNREWSHLHVKPSNVPRNCFGGWYLAQTRAVSGRVAMTEQYKCWACNAQENSQTVFNSSLPMHSVRIRHLNHSFQALTFK